MATAVIERRRLPKTATPIAALCLSGLALAGCRARQTEAARADAQPPAQAALPAASTSFYRDQFSRRATVAQMTDLGRRLFSDPALSASGKMSCASCHDPRLAYGPPNDRPTQLGGPDMKSAGIRAVPSLRYLQAVPPFSEHHFDEAVDESVDQGPTGGHGWDGRVDSAHEQARLPLTSPFEMANESMSAVTAKVLASAYADAFRQAYGDDVFATSDRAEAAVLKALEVFEQSPKDFYPYSSRYDAWLRHQGELTQREQHGMALFGDPQKGNCASCHPHQMRHGSFPGFTDFGFSALGVPRNRAIPANDDAAFHDLGLCGPLRTDLAAHKEYCGQFRVPTLRNVARRRVFFHNGAFHRLEDVLAFYVQRDASPAAFYGVEGGHADLFDDVPTEYRANVHRDAPFGRHATPPLSKPEIEDVIAFLKTLTDADVTAE